MSGYRSFARNVGILTIASFSTKIMSLLLVPLYTRVLTTSEYGAYDLVNNAIAVLIPILTQNIVDSILRFSIDKDVDNSQVIRIGLKHFGISLLPLIVMLGANSILGVSAELNELAPFVLLIYVGQCLANILLFYARGLNRFADVAISSVLTSFVVIGCNIVFLVLLGWGLTGYFIANAIGPVLQVVYLFLRLEIFRIRPARIDKKLEREMLSFGRPIMANNIAWWVNNLSDRFVVTLFWGVAANGIYAVAFKIPMALSVIQGIVGQAWTVSAVEEFDPDDKRGFFANIYSLYNCIMVLMCTVIIALDRIIANFLFANDFFQAWRYVPFLTISMIFGAMAGFVGGVFQAVKDAKELARSTVVGALANIILNLLTVPVIGPIGSAAATAVSYWLVWHLRMRAVRKYIRLRITIGRDYAAYVLLIIQSILLFVTQSRLSLLYGLQAACVVVIFLMYRKEVGRFSHKVIETLRRR